MKIIEVTNFLEQYAPLEYQETYDNCGLIIGDANAEIKGVLITLDCTESVIDELIKLSSPNQEKKIFFLWPEGIII